MLKFATDGAVLTKTKNAVQGTMKLIPCDANGKAMVSHHVYSKCDKETTLYYFIGMIIRFISPLVWCLIMFVAWNLPEIDAATK